MYLAVQVRQNTSALRTASRQEIVEGMRAHLALRIAPDAARAYADGLEKFPDLPFDDRSLFTAIIADLALFMQGAFALHEAGTLEDETYEAYLRFFLMNVATPGGMVWWKEVAHPIFLPRMVRAMDARLAESSDLGAVALSFYQWGDSSGEASSSGAGAGSTSVP